MSKTILVVEDDRSVQRMLQEILEDEGFSIICEKDGDWALNTFEAKEIDFVILDILVPVMNGFQVAERIRKMPKGRDVPILMISGIYRGASHRDEAISRYGAVEYLDKPIDPDRLLEILEDAFGAEYPSAVAAEAERTAIDRKAPEPYASPESRQETEEVEKRSAEFFGAARRGSLDDAPFPELLAEMYRERAGGALLLRRDRVKKIVYFFNGYPTFVKSNLLNECLGKVMVREKMITESECEASILRMKESKRQQGTVLIEMGCISPHNLQFALELQLQIKLFDLFGWEEGEFQYSPKANAPPTTVSLGASTAALIYEGVRRKHSLDRLRRLLDDSLDLYVMPHPDPLFRFQGMDLDPDEENLVARLKGDLTLREILDLGLDKRAAYQIVYALKCAGMITLELEPGVDLNESVELKRPPVSSSGRRARPGQQQPDGPAAAPSSKDSINGRLADDGDARVLGEVGHRSNLSPQERSLREQLAREAMEMKKRDYFEILGVSRNASAAEVEKAYFSLAKQYHPDRLYARASAEVRRLAEELFNMISTAYEVLTDEQRRADYLDQLFSGAKRDVSSEVSKILSAEGIFQNGEMALRRRNYARAKELFAQAMRLCPEEGEFHAYLGWSIFQSEPKNEEAVRQARDQLSQAISLNPRVDKAYLFLGYIYKAMNYKEMAEHEFEKAIQCNPDCTEALRELRLINMGRQGKKKGRLPRR